VVAKTIKTQEAKQEAQLSQRNSESVMHCHCHCS